jgi:hypothetical protein
VLAFVTSNVTEPAVADAGSGVTENSWSVTATLPPVPAEASTLVPALAAVLGSVEGPVLVPPPQAPTRAATLKVTRNDVIRCVGLRYMKEVSDAGLAPSRGYGPSWTSDLSVRSVALATTLQRLVLPADPARA